MTNIKFWAFWNIKNKILYFLLFLVFLFTAGIYIYSSYNSLGSVIHWEIVTQWERLPVLASPLQIALFDFDLYAENYIVSESFSASQLVVNIATAKTYLILLGFGLSFLLAVLSVLPRFWYVLGMAAFIFIITSFKLEQLRLFSREDITGVVVILFLYIPLSYYLHAIRPDIRFFVRCLLFLLMTICVGIIIGVFADNPNPWLYMANYGLAGPVILSIIFIFIVAHEIIVAFLHLITNYNTKYSRNSLYHFVGLSFVYLLNVFFAYMHNMGALHWDIFYINAFILLVCSSIVGIWGFRKRSIIFNNIIPVNGPGEVLYIALGIICFSTIGYLFYAGNDPIIETFEDAIIFSHFGFGLFFFIYVLVNFFTLLNENLRVIKVVYKPVRMPYYMANFGGLAVIILFFLRSNLFPYYQAVAGYFNGIGDIYVAENNLYLAEQYYRLASGYEFQNHRSNYSLASLAMRQDDQATALFYYRQALNKNPSEQAYINLANIYKDNSRIFDAVFTLKEGLERFSGSGPIQNNLALFYSRLNMPDSALIFLKNAMLQDESKNPAQTNALSIYAKSGGNLRPDSVSQFLNKSDHIPVLANMLVIENQDRTQTSVELKKEVLSDSVLDMNTFSYFNNYVFSTYINRDSSVLKELNALEAHPDNYSYHENLSFLRAMHSYYHNDVASAFKILDNLRGLSSSAAGYYNYILGVWAAEQYAPLLSAQYFDEAVGYKVEDAALLKGVSLSLANNPDRAREYWSSLVYEKDTILINNASEMLKVINLDKDLSVPEEDESFIYRSILFNHPELSQIEVNDLLKQLHNRDLMANALYEIVIWNIRNKNIHAAKTYLEDLIAVNNNIGSVSVKIPWLEALIIAENKDVAILKEQIKELFPKNKEEEWHHIYFKALVFEFEKDTAMADSLYRLLATNNPFYERGVIEAERYFNMQGQDIFAYNILQSALEINSTSKTLHRHFVLQALRVGLFEYAENALEDYKDLASNSEFNNLNKIYKAKLEEIKQENLGWE